VSLTPSGQALLDGIEKVFVQIEHSLRSAREAAVDNEFKLSFGLVEYTNLRFVPPALIRLQALYPDVKIVRHEMNTVQQVAALRANEIDVGFGALLNAADGSGLEQTTLLSSDWVLLMPRGHRLATLDRLRVDDLASERLIIFERSINAPLYDGVVEACGNAGFKPNFVYETSQAQIGVDLVEQGLGVMLGTTYVFATHPEALVYRPVDGFEPLVIDVFSRDGENNPLILDFMELAKEEASKLSALINRKSSLTSD
jgi:DNA-binding transcriptional LysR family regulator